MKKNLVRTTFSIPEHLKQMAEELATRGIFGVSTTSASDVYRYCLDNSISLKELYEKTTGKPATA